MQWFQFLKQVTIPSSYKPRFKVFEVRDSTRTPSAPPAFVALVPLLLGPGLEKVEVCWQLDAWQAISRPDLGQERPSIMAWKPGKKDRRKFRGGLAEGELAVPLPAAHPEMDLPNVSRCNAEGHTSRSRGFRCVRVR